MWRWSCARKSAGVSLLEGDTFRWVAVAGSFSKFLGGRTPTNFSPCGVCMERNRAQLYKVDKPYYDFLGIEAEPIREGILLPWHAGQQEGTIWIVSQQESGKFDREGYRLAQMLADFAAIAVRHQEAMDTAREQEQLAASARTANELAHQINNPLQSLTNAVYLLRKSEAGYDKGQVMEIMSTDLQRLSDLVKKILSLPQMEI